jgi:hypothetical protein
MSAEHLQDAGRSKSETGRIWVGSSRERSGGRTAGFWRDKRADVALVTEMLYICFAQAKLGAS